MQIQSLADLAGIDTTEVKELRMENLPEMQGIFKVTSAVMGQRENAEGEIKFGVQFKFEVLETEACLVDGVKPESLVGKTHTEFRNLDTSSEEKLTQSFGYIKSFVADCGCSNTGAPGGVEGQPPGYLDAMVETVLRAKIVEKVGKDRVKRTNLHPIVVTA